ncbi:diphthine-ammonia ligase isoform X1 [Astyanax mexicanus]|uniref:Diphthine--ammonia ligase n=1 Tax=Astyanax mexicanus TaxID=7994 RepID=A0A8T2LFU5_ASTMX|nr:diphthine-ammonia ligase isoform X1 [Astyanax mexicanus]
MRVVALISGGKDSCYNMMQCVAAGHAIVALANLRPAKADEIDSYMYQTVGHQAIDLYAEAMGLPLYRRTIEGSSLDTGREYSQKEGDEVEDLYHLLKLVKEKEGVEAVSVGAILSDYQRVRVENVCSRLQLQPLAYLWWRDQAALLKEMISSGVHALLIKVAAFGLDPGKHLGKTLAEMELCLQQLSQKYGVHICGEGGEYETFTTDCPLFKKKIVIDKMETVIHSADAFAPVGYLRFTQMHTEDKDIGSTESALPLGSCPCQSAIDKMTEEAVYADKTQDIQEEFTSNACRPWCSARSSVGYQWITGLGGLPSEHTDVRGQTQHALTQLQGELKERGFQLKHIVLVHLYVKNMEDFAEVNSVYCTFFSHNPPARVCVQTCLSAGQLLQMDVLLHDWTLPPQDGCFHQRDTLHVQSLSHWAPANIGPYSQAVRVDEAVFCAGQIALVPCTMKLLNRGPASQAQMSYSHVEKVLSAMGQNLTLSHVLQAHCYVSHHSYIPSAKEVWSSKLQEKQDQVACFGAEEIQGTPLVVAVVPSLPRGAAVELHVIAVQDDPAERTFSHQALDVPGGTIQWDLLQSSTGQYATLSLSVSLTGSCTSPGLAETETILQALGSSMQQAVAQMKKTLSPLCARVFYRSSSRIARELSAGLEGCLESMLGQSRPALVLVPVLELPDCAALHLSCWLSI